MAVVRRAPMAVVHEDEHTWGAAMARRIVFYLLDVLEALLAFRFFLALLGANPASPFVQFIYMASEPFVYPFRGIFPQVSAQGAVLEWAVLLAMVVYAVVAWGIGRLIWILMAHEEPVGGDYETHDRDDVGPGDPYV
jgi:uncharacterized protein YggT (Ycf19 family)